MLTFKNQSNFTISDKVISDQPGYGITINNCFNVNIVNCYISGCTKGVYAINSENINVSNCTFKNLNPQNLDKMGHAIQFNNSYGSITKNVIINEPGKGFPCDNISLYKSFAPAGSSSLVEHNFVQGGVYPSGSGIMSGDHGGENQIIKNNLILDPGNVGIGMAGANNTTVENNIIMMKQSSVSNVGMYVWSQYSPTNNVVVQDNIVSCVNKLGKSNPFYQNLTTPYPTTNVTIQDNILGVEPYTVLVPSNDWGYQS